MPELPPSPPVRPLLPYTSFQTLVHPCTCTQCLRHLIMEGRLWASPKTLDPFGDYGSAVCKSSTMYAGFCQSSHERRLDSTLERYHYILLTYTNLQPLPVEETLKVPYQVSSWQEAFGVRSASAGAVFTGRYFFLACAAPDPCCMHSRLQVREPVASASFCSTPPAIGARVQSHRVLILSPNL